MITLTIDFGGYFSSKKIDISGKLTVITLHCSYQGGNYNKKGTPIEVPSIKETFH